MSKGYKIFAAFSLVAVIALLMLTIALTHSVTRPDYTSHPMGLAVLWPIIWILWTVLSTNVATPALALAIGSWAKPSGRFAGAVLAGIGGAATAIWTSYLVRINSEAISTLLESRPNLVGLVVLIPAVLGATYSLALIVLAFTGHRFFKQKARPG
ncbi:hypothetical protein [Maricaulis parjimensis]|uniref:hypothetical protein n=1 Tax=Maricaulis parjimensis TaxID=144023 RepID=UPI00193951C7|nr:hypothetical protein [Maricaulis parjimensis]